MRKILTSSIVFGIISISSCAKDKAEIPCDTISFSQQVNTIITQNCISCHSSSAVMGSLENYTNIKAKADDGKLVDRVEKKMMPPSGSNPLTDSQIRTIKCWVNQGAPNN
jgi:uncharacterized membrane protein